MGSSGHTFMMDRISNVNVTDAERVTVTMYPNARCSCGGLDDGKACEHMYWIARHIYDIGEEGAPSPIYRDASFKVWFGQHPPPDTLEQMRLGVHRVVAIEDEWNLRD